MLRASPQPGEMLRLFRSRVQVLRSRGDAKMEVTLPKLLSITSSSLAAPNAAALAVPLSSRYFIVWGKIPCAGSTKGNC